MTNLPAMPSVTDSETASLPKLLLIGVISFLTLVDLFAAQAILPSLAAAYGVMPSAMSAAVNACTIGMAIAGVVIALFGNRIDPRRGIIISLALLSAPTVLLAAMPSIEIFALLRVLQGVFMSAAFTLTMTYLAGNFGAKSVSSALAAYVTGNVACNFFGRLMAATLVGFAGLEATFYVFAALNLAGALLVYLTLNRMPATRTGHRAGGLTWLTHLKNPPLRATFALGFLILFVFLGIFTYVNFVLVAAPLSLPMMTLGLVYFIFVPSIITTPFAGRAAASFGIKSTLWTAFAIALAGLPLLAADGLPAILLGLALVAAGTFFAQAAATGYVGRIAIQDRGSASGIYLACYYAGGLAGSSLLGLVFDTLGWSATLLTTGGALALACLIIFALSEPSPNRQPSNHSPRLSKHQPNGISVAAEDRAL